MTKPNPMYGVGRWYPTSTYAHAHFIRLDSTPGNFRTACGLHFKYVSDRSSANGRNAEHCQRCTAAIAPIGGPTP